MKKLREDRSHRAAGHDDRSLGSKRPAGADGDCRRQRLQHGDLRLHLAAAEQNGFKGFRNAVAANFFRSVARHQTDHQPADHRHENHLKAKMMMVGRLKHGRPAPIESEIGDDCDQPYQSVGDNGAQSADDQRHPGKDEDPFISAKVR